MAWKTSCAFLFFFFAAQLSWAQGGELLVQQYNKYPYDHEFYRTWNFALSLQPHLTNTSDRNTNQRLNVDLGADVFYRFTKTVGLQSGVHYQRTSYRYAQPNDLSIDRLRYLRFPLLLTVHPVRRLTLALGGSFHWFLNGTGLPPPATERSFYSKKTFVNTTGVYAQVQYRFYRKWTVSVSYRIQRRNNLPYGRVTQNTRGLGLGFHYTLLHPTQRPLQ